MLKNIEDYYFRYVIMLSDRYTAKNKNTFIQYMLRDLEMFGYQPEEVKLDQEHGMLEIGRNDKIALVVPYNTPMEDRDGLPLLQIAEERKNNFKKVLVQLVLVVLISAVMFFYMYKHINISTTVIVIWAVVTGVLSTSIVKGRGVKGIQSRDMNILLAISLLSKKPDNYQIVFVDEGSFNDEKITSFINSFNQVYYLDGFSNLTNIRLYELNTDIKCDDFYKDWNLITESELKDGEFIRPRESLSSFSMEKLSSSLAKAASDINHRFL